MTGQPGEGEPMTVREQRELAGQAGVGEVILTEGPPTAADSRAAAARAWLSIARALSSADARDDAYRAASAGLDELGEAYRADDLEDDTTLKLLAAEDAHENGLEYAAGAMARVLETRLALFEEAQPGRRVSPSLDAS